MNDSDDRPLTVDDAQQLGAGSWLFPGSIAPAAPAVLAAIDRVTKQAPLRHMQTPGGFTMSAAMSNCGDYGWLSTPGGYRYTDCDPETGRPWPVMPALLHELAGHAADRAGYHHFSPDVCLINRYEPGAKMSLHQDRDESDFSQPIVSFSLGLPMTFLFGGLQRRERPRRLVLNHGDVLVWGGPDRLRYHGVAPLKEGWHPLLGRCRINLTFRRAA